MFKKTKPEPHLKVKKYNEFPQNKKKMFETFYDEAPTNI